jgi:DnaJ homolog subfamily B member 4
MKDFYDTLGVSRNASESEIKKAYRKMSLEFHPDKNSSPSASSKFQEINEAYETLGDVQKRKQYDMFGNSDGPFGGGGGGMPGGMPFGFPPGFHFAGGPNIRVHTMNGGRPGPGGPSGPNIAHIFEQFFNGPMGGIFEEMESDNQSSVPNMPNMPNIRIFQQGPGSQPGKPHFVRSQSPPPPVEKKIPISLEQAYSGFQLKMEVEGSNDPNETIMEIQVPSGIEHDEVIIISNKGASNQFGRGDLHLHFTIEKHEFFERKNMDLYCKKTISLKEALCGFTISIQHVSGKLIRLSNQKQNIVIPGFVREIPNFGMQRPQDGRPTGKLVIEFDVQYPTTLTVEQKEQLEKIL